MKINTYKLHSMFKVFVVLEKYCKFSIGANKVHNIISNI